jgi:hypothetical protein
VGQQVKDRNVSLSASVPCWVEFMDGLIESELASIDQAADRKAQDALGDRHGGKGAAAFGEAPIAHQLFVFDEHERSGVALSSIAYQLLDCPGIERATLQDNRLRTRWHAQGVRSFVPFLRRLFSERRSSFEGGRRRC